MIFYSLDRPNNIDATKIINDISKLISTIPKHEIKHNVLVISLQKIINYAGDNPITKIEYKGDSLT